MNRPTRLIVLLLLTAASVPYAANAARRIVRVSDYGLHPGSGRNALPVVRRIIEENKGVRGLQIRFDEGRYDFYPDAERQAAGKPTTAFALTQTDGVEIDGGGCDWIFHGLMNPGAALGVPQHDAPQRAHRLAAALQLAGDDRFGDGHLFRYGDRCRRYPYVVAGDSLAFVGEYGLQRIVPEYTNLYDAATHELLYQTRDVPLGRDMFRGPGHRPREQPGAFPLPPGHEARTGNRRRLFPRTLHHQRHRNRRLPGRPASNR